MKLQLLYLFILAAPLLVRVISSDATTAPATAETRETAPAKTECADLPAKSETAPAPKDSKKTKDASARQIPAAHIFTFM